MFKNFIVRYIEVIIFSIVFIFVKDDFDLAYITILSFLGYLFIKHAFMKVITNMRWQFVAMSMVIFFFAPHYDPNDGFYLVSGRIVKHYETRTRNSLSYNTDIVYLDVDGDIKIKTSSDRNLYTFEPLNSCVLLLMPLMQNRDFSVGENKAFRKRFFC